MKIRKIEFINTKLFFIISVAFFTVSYFISDPTMQTMYFFYCTYRIQTLIKLSRTIILALIIFLFFYRVFLLFTIHKKILFGFIPFFLLMYFGYFVACIVNAGNDYLPRWWDALSSSLVPLFIFNLCVDESETYKLLIRVISLFYLFFAVLNLIFFFFPQLYFGDAREWHEAFFLGSKNRAGWPLMLGAFFHLINERINKNRIETIIYLILVIVNSYIIFCITSLIGVFVFILYYFIPLIKKAFQKWKFSFFLLIILLMFVLLMWFLLPITVSKPVWFILSLFGKSPGLSDRYDIWETGIKLVLKQPLFGYGLGESTGIIPHTNIYGTTFHHAHNEFLQCWFEGGLLTVLFVFLSLYFCGRTLDRCNDREFVGVGKMTLFSFLLMLQGDILPYYPWFMVSLIANCSLIFSSIIMKDRVYDSDEYNR